MSHKAKSQRTRYKNDRVLKALGEHCRKLRIRKGYSIDRMAKEGDQLSPAAIHRLESGDSDPQFLLLYRYAKVLGVDVTTLLSFPSKDNLQKQTGIVRIEEGEAPPENSIPVYTMKIAAGQFDPSNTHPVDPLDWIQVDLRGPLHDYFAAYVTGKSMEPTIPDGSLCLFKVYRGGTRQNKIMLVKTTSPIDPETGNAFAVKRYLRKTRVGESTHRENVVIHLVSDNKDFRPIILSGLSEDEVSTPAEFIKPL